MRNEALGSEKGRSLHVGAFSSPNHLPLIPCKIHMGAPGASVGIIRLNPHTQPYASSSDSGPNHHFVDPTEVEPGNME